MSIHDLHAFSLPTQEERELARISGQTLADCPGETVQIRIGEQGASYTLPANVVKALAGILQAAAGGQSVAVMSMQSELNVQQSADMLDVSVPYMLELLQNEEIPSRQEGTHHFVRLGDLLDYEYRTRQQRKDVLTELAAEAQRLELGY